MANEKRLISVLDATKVYNGIALYMAENAYLNDTALDVLKMVASWLNEAPTVDAVEVSRLGKLGRLMMPYKGCPRGRIGAYGAVGGNTTVTEIHITELDAIVDVEGDRWIPVLAEDLRNLKAKLKNAVEVVHGRWIHVPSSDMMTGKAYKCSECNKMRYGSFMPNYCQNCGAKMDGDGNA